MYDNAVQARKECRGRIQVYTGSGKGKTTAALGLAFRALGHGKKVLLIQFMKKGQGLGEIKAAQRFPEFKILQAGRSGWVRKGQASLQDKRLARKGWKAARKAIKTQKYDLLILDELNVAIDYGLLQLKQIKEVMKNRPKNIEVVITGRYAHPEILEMADLVSEVRARKHYYKKGITARAGIEY